MKKLFFFGNYFYGLCVVALSIEAALQQKILLPPIIYFLFIFCATVVFYTKAYIAETINTTANERSIWYVKNHKTIITTQIIFTVLIALFGLLLLPNIISGAKLLSYSSIFLFVSFPLVALLYYGFTKKLSLRNIHWLKPFVIGFVWSGIVTLFPLFYHQLQLEKVLELNVVSCLLFIKNLMFIAVLCIMFDIKDYATDYNQHLKTFVVSFGLRKTIFNILIPLTVIGFASFLVVAFNNQFSIMIIMLNTIPFVLLLFVAFSLTKRKSIFYYVIIIDGLMLVKALCGIAATIISG